MSPVHSIQKRPAHSGALFNRFPATSPVAPPTATAMYLLIGGVQPGDMATGFNAAPDP